MKIVALEEHYTTPEATAAWNKVPADRRGTAEFTPTVTALLGASLEERRATMDDQGVDVQVLSLNSPGLQTIAAADARSLARDSNDALAAYVSGDPERFQGFAALPTADPDDAATELERAVTSLGFPGALINGRTGGRMDDDRAFDPLWASADRLGVPIYLHPQTPDPSVRASYYSGLGDALDGAFATTVIGWHYEAGLQLLRMIAGGVFDRNPGLQVVLGHWGEVVLFFLDRAVPQLEKAGLHLDRPPLEVIRQNVWVTGGGILSERYLSWCVDVLGADRIMSATDYPWVDNGGGKARSFIENAPLTDEQKLGIASGNWERLIARRA